MRVCKLHGGDPPLEGWKAVGMNQVHIPGRPFNASGSSVLLHSSSALALFRRRWNGAP